MSKRPSLKDNSPLAGFVTEEETPEEAVKQSSSHKTKKSGSHNGKQSNNPRSNEIQQETLYLHPEQVIDLEDLVLKMKRRKSRIKTSKSAIARAAIDLLLKKNEDELAKILEKY